MTHPPLPLAESVRLANPGDNVAVAIRDLPAGGHLAGPDGPVRVAFDVLEGHRLALRPIPRGSELCSWGLPFGRALVDIAPGDYLCNASMLAALRQRSLPLSLPAGPNFEDRLSDYVLDPARFQPGEPVPVVDRPRTFLGYDRGGRRGVGTRNTLVILGTTARTAGAAQELARRLQPLLARQPGIDAIVPVSHTEGGEPGEPNNAEKILRCLAGFIVHPNVGAIVALDQGSEPVNNARLRTYLDAHDYPAGEVPHAFVSLGGRLASGLAEAEALVRGWIPAVAAAVRTEQPLAALRVALQCGGSDAFSGISGNPLAGAVVHEVIRHGGAGNMAETDELVGAEAYLVRNQRDLATAQAMLHHIATFKERLAWHGETAEGNPSAGNKLRGLYNIALKSLGAVHKKDPRSRVEAVIAYGEPMVRPGFHLMESPGNDLESIAGQVASGCNLILFVTGNGSITNFPFVPTLKFTTTTRRHERLIAEMDVNAGRYLDGEPMAALVDETFEQVIAAASGARTKGERAGHSQVSLWRNWRQTDARALPALLRRTLPDGRPLFAAGDLPPPPAPTPDGLFPAYRSDGDHWALERRALILPTSLCATQIARLAAERLNRGPLGPSGGGWTFATLLHTEGCGYAGADLTRLLLRTYEGYATHPHVAATLLLEHGCEKIPNDAFRRHGESRGLPLDRFGWASVQGDGGIENSLLRIEQWFAATLPGRRPPTRTLTGLGSLALAFRTAAPPGAGRARAFARLALEVVGAGGSVLVAASDPLFAESAFTDALPPAARGAPSLGTAQILREPGFHAVDTESDDWSENLAGLGACGAHLLLTLNAGDVLPGHPLLPVLQFSPAAGEADETLDGVLPPEEDEALAVLRGRLLAFARGEHVPATRRLGLAHFQITRGLLGVST